MSGRHIKVWNDPTNVVPIVRKGGPGSGNFGHAGRPGSRGGSSGGGGAAGGGGSLKGLSMSERREKVSSAITAQYGAAVAKEYVDDSEAEEGEDVWAQFDTVEGATVNAYLYAATAEPGGSIASIGARTPTSEDLDWARAFLEEFGS